jgi:hypothetical protein
MKGVHFSEFQIVLMIQFLHQIFLIHRFQLRLFQEPI